VPTTTLDWDGDDWEKHCLNLLRMRYRAPGEFEIVPASDRGDLGIEGFSHDGCAYQCYAPMGPLPIKDRYERQRDKLTEDVGKLHTNQTELMAILDGVVIGIYAFMTPVHDSRRLNAHAKAKAAEIRARCLPHCSPDFTIVIQTEDDYVIERQELLNLGLHKLHLGPLHVPEAAVHSYVASNPDLIATIDEKLSRLPGLGAAERTRLRTRLLRQKLMADNKLVEIRGHHAAAWERVQELRAAREGVLEMECLLNTADPRDLLQHTASAYRDTLRESLVFLADRDASDIAWGTTTDWLAECPLDFGTRGAL
jgi:hypothetical protein